jgi:hypothetical protein
MKRIRVAGISLKDREKRPIGDGMFASPNLTGEDIAKVKAAIERTKVEEEIKATYKIEVTFGVKHHVDGTPTYGIINFWENGSALGGDADVLVYICPGKSIGVNTCENVIPDKMNGFGFVACPTCHQVWKRESLIGEVFYRMPIYKWADALLYWFTRMGHDADIKIKYNYRDIRVAAGKEQSRAMHGDLLRKVRSKDSRKPRSYPLAHILKDVSNGADLHAQFLRFVRM